ncbi:hypothetical protein EBB07_29490 [Paenibacillaceae bacterium]|nr:hypothetical protein EBB07_29490 [Paenibacillaceae bacterium]
MKYTVVKIGRMASTNVDAYLETVQSATPIENGSHIVLGDLIPGGDLNTYKALAPTDVNVDDVLIVESPVLVEVEGMRIDIRDPRKFINAKDRPLRARRLKQGDSVTISIDGFTDVPTVGQYVVPVNGSYKLAPSTTIGTSKLVYKVELKTSIPIAVEYLEAYKLKVIKS